MFIVLWGLSDSRVSFEVSYEAQRKEGGKEGFVQHRNFVLLLPRCTFISGRALGCFV